MCRAFFVYFSFDFVSFCVFKLLRLDQTLADELYALNNMIEKSCFRYCGDARKNDFALRSSSVIDSDVYCIHISGTSYIRHVLCDSQQLQSAPARSC